MGKTTIEWTDKTWNPVRGCSRVSAGCENCYAERQAGRFSGPGQAYEGLVQLKPGGFRWTGDIKVIEKELIAPLKWRKPQKIFVNSMSDLFHTGISDLELTGIFDVMIEAHKTHGHIFQILTKRAERMNLFVHVYLTSIHPGERYLPGIWLGVSVENQEAANERIPLLVGTPAQIRFISAEPLLGQIDLREWFCRWEMLNETTPSGKQLFRCKSCMRENVGPDKFCDVPRQRVDCSKWIPPIQWVITGAESGPGARPMNVGHVRLLRDHCKASNVAFFYKQDADKHGKKIPLPELDGKTWAEFPRVRE